MHDFWDGFRKGFRRALRYGYFAPIQAAVFAVTRPQNGYVRHLLALYRLAFPSGGFYKATRDRLNHDEKTKG